jgi:hypothetical protein
MSTTATKTYKLTVSAIGYESTTLIVKASTKLVAKMNFEREAFRKFAKHNDISMPDARGFGSISYSINQ